jgi:hypothetical protein
MDLIPSNAPHWHILLNHLPSIGAVFGLVLLLAALYLKSEDLRRTSLLTFVLMSLLAIPTYITGAATKWAIQGNEGISLDVIAVHQDSALLALTFLGITGCFAWLGLWQTRRNSNPPGWNNWIVLAFAILAVGFIVKTGSLGGDINHPEINVGEEMMVVQDEPGRTVRLQETINRTPWLWPAMEAAHFVGMAIIFGVVLVVCLRVLGYGKKLLPVAALHRILPLGVLGLLVNIVTGMVFFIGDSSRYVAIEAFFWKIVLIVIGGVTLMFFTIFHRPWSLGADDDAAPIAKVVAAGTIILWAAVLLCGRLLPYLEG